MLSLAQATKETRLLIKFSAIFLGIIVLLLLLFRFGNYLLLQISPPVPSAPEERFGKLPSLNFPNQEEYNIDFVINTVSGYLPVFPDRINIYKIKKGDAGLFNLQSARNSLTNIGFDQQETKISDTVYRWGDKSKNLTRQIEYDIISRNFNIYSDYLDNKSLLANQGLLQSQGITDIPVNFLKTIGSDLNDLDLSKTKLSYFKLDSKDFIEVGDKSLAQIVKIGLVQAPINNVDIYYSDFTGSDMNFIIGERERRLEILESNFTHLTPDTNKFSEYAIKTSQQAFKDLEEGEGYVYNPKGKTKVDIKDVYIGYFLGNDENQEYLYPIAVFSGNDFLAYISLLP
ncbi:hypothetical protein C4577_00530 [Candidatus Parcubacteria bacterium]|nr:MAG: hypothetical protein C4577_00530 [Candidatus Parcubacteria bacterium]